MPESQFVTGILTDPSVLPRGRAIGLARILCRPDIVAHLAAHGHNVKAGRLAAHIEAVSVSAERALRGLTPNTQTARALMRHKATGVTREQRMFVWAAFVDAYLTAAKLAGHHLTVRGVWQYMAAAQRFGNTFGLQELPVGVEDMQALIARLMSRIQPASVPRGVMVMVGSVAESPWFMRSCNVPSLQLHEAIQHSLPPLLWRAINR